MRSVSAYEHTLVAKSVGHQPPSNKVFLSDYFIVKIRPYAEDSADCFVAIDCFQSRILISEIVAHQPSVSAIDREDDSAAAADFGPENTKPELQE